MYGNISVFAADGSFDPNTGKRTAGKMLGVAPLIVPILTTDSLQATRRTNSSTAKREIGLALNLLRSAGSVGATYGRDQENENEAAGADLESVVTVGRLSDNTVRIRLGADPMPGGGYGMVPRTFNISALVFVPKSANQLYYVSRLSLHNVLTGEELSTQRIPSYDEEIDSIVRRSKLDFPSLTAKVLKNPLDDYVFHGEFEEFEKFLTTFLPSGTTPYEKRREILYMWSQLTALNRKSRMANSLVDIPRPPPMQCPSNPLVIYSADDKAISVSLAGGKDFNVNQLKRSVLHVQSTCAQADTQQGARKSTGASAPKMTGRAAAEIKPPPQAVSCDIKKPPLSYPIPALSAETAKDGTSVALKFPPIAKLELTALPLSTQLKPESLGVFGCGGNLGTEQRYTGLALVSVKEEKDDSDAKKVALVPDSRVIIASKEGKGRMAFVVIGGGKKDLKVLVHNGTVTGFEDYAKKPISRKGIAWDVSDGGRYVLTLENLSVTALPQIELISRPADAKKNTTLDTAELRVEEGRK